MENIFVKSKKNISKIFILALIFIGVIGALTMVNAANEETINLVVGQSITKNPGIQTKWGGYESIKYEIGKSETVEVTQTGAEVVGFYGERMELKFTAKKAGECKIKVTYAPNFWDELKEKTYIIKVEANGVKSIKVIGAPSNNIYNAGDKINLTGIKVSVTNSDGTDGGLAPVSELTCTPTVAPSESGDHKITVEYKGAKATFEIHVDPTNNGSDEDGNNNNDNDNGSNSDEVYTNKLTAGDTLKLKSGSGWKKYTSKNMNSKYKTMTGGTTFTIKEIDGNWITIKDESTYKFLYYGKEASKYFSKVTTSNNTNNNNSGSNSNQGSNNNQNASNNKPTVSTAPQYSNGTAVKTGDSIKMTKGNSWNVYSDSSCKSIKSYIQSNKGLTYKVEAISGNIIKLSQSGKEIGYIKWYNSNTGAKNYFSNVETSSNNNTGTNTQGGTEQGCFTENTSMVLNMVASLLQEILEAILTNITTATK